MRKTPKLVYTNQKYLFPKFGVDVLEEIWNPVLLRAIAFLHFDFEYQSCSRSLVRGLLSVLDNLCKYMSAMKDYDFRSCIE